MKKIFITYVLLCLFFISGCAFYNIKKMEPGRNLAAGETLIFGKVVFLEDGEELTPYGFFKRPSPTLFHADSGKYSWTITGKEGEFSWIVPAGSYMVPEVQFGSGFVHPKMAFLATEPGGFYYLGTIRIEISRAGLFSDEIHMEGVTITDESGDLGWAEGFRSKAEKSLAVHDPSFPSDLTDRESITNFLLLFSTPNLRAR